MKWNRICVALLTAALAVPAFGQISVFIGTPPPPLRYERRAPIPGPGFVWVEGYWAPYGHHYRWVPGRWERPPYEGAYWSHPHYDHYREGWQLHEGHWDREDHGNHYWRDHDDHHDDNH
ncbi:MAG: YXWGXW repeat-containing protein [Terriglobales bacterium]